MGCYSNTGRCRTVSVGVAGFRLINGLKSAGRRAWRSRSTAADGGASGVGRFIRRQAGFWCGFCRVAFSRVRIICGGATDVGFRSAEALWCVSGYGSVVTGRCGSDRLARVGNGDSGVCREADRCCGGGCCSCVVTCCNGSNGSRVDRVRFGALANSIFGGLSGASAFSR